MSVEMPWVRETRLAPGQKPKRNPAWGIVAISGAVIMGMFLIGAFVTITTGLGAELFSITVVIWGIVTLATIGSAIGAYVRRGTVNLTLASIALAIAIIANPLIIFFLDSVAQLFLA